MDIAFFIVFLFSCSFVTAADECVDSCREGAEQLRTCSCDSSCVVFGTCCADSDNARKMAPLNKAEFRCNSDKTVTPVYAKRACLDSFNLHPDHRTMCEGAEHDDWADPMGNVLVTSRRTRITYWNRDCGICNEENPDDLIRWTIQVTCPSKHGNTKFNQNHIENHLHFNKDIDEWGLIVEDGFRICALSFAEPRKMTHKLTYCAPNLISRCPIGYPKRGVVEKCHAYHAERRLKGAEPIYYRNAHCAQCNGVGEEELECVGRDYEKMGVSMGRDSVMVSFDQEWLERKGLEQYKCSRNNSWDPFNNKCRKLPLELWKELTAKPPMMSHAQKATLHCWLTVIIAIASYDKYRFL